MNPFLNEDEQLIVESAHEFRIREMEADPNCAEEYSPELVKKAADLGMFLLKVPAEYGGVDVSEQCYCEILEELAKTPSEMGGILNHQNGAARMLAAAGTAEQKKWLFDRVITGECIAALGVSESCGCTNYPEWPNMGVTIGDEIVLNGTKIYQTFGLIAGVSCVSCRIDGNRAMIFVDLDSPGITRGEKVVHLHGDSPDDMCVIEFNDVHVPKANLVQGKNLTSDLKSAASYLEMCALALGNAEGIYEKTLEYVTNRTRYEKPMASFQRVAHRLVDMKTTIDVAKAWIMDAARRVDEGIGEPIRFYQGKMWIPETCFNLVNQCIVLHGGLGIDKEMGLGHYQAFAQRTLFMERPSDIHRDMVASLMGLSVDFVW